jgi:hypothetical protein
VGFWIDPSTESHDSVIKYGSVINGAYSVTSCNAFSVDVDNPK